MMKLLLRYLARFAATALGGFVGSNLLGLATLRALLVGAIAGAIPVLHYALDVYARTGKVPDPIEVPE
jgi:hypothetical protein